MDLLNRLLGIKVLQPPGGSSLGKGSYVRCILCCVGGPTGPSIGQRIERRGLRPLGLEKGQDLTKVLWCERATTPLRIDAIELGRAAKGLFVRPDARDILKNLGEVLEGCLARHLAAKRKKHTQDTLEQHDPIEQAPRVVRRSPKVAQLQQAYREERLACYEQVIALRQLGLSQERIAEQVGIGHSTVSR